MGKAVFGAPEFKARSGRMVKVGEDGSLSIDHMRGYLSPEVVMDVEEWAQAKRDIVLGRWRWPENPDYVVYRGRDDDDTVVVIDERNGSNAVYDRGDSDSEFERWKSHHEAARAYFEAHPERKPWHDAEVGEVWLLTKDGTEGEFAAVVSDPAITFAKSFDAAAFAFHLDDSGIRSGRRIWPEDAS